MKVYDIMQSIATFASHNKKPSSSSKIEYMSWYKTNKICV